MGTTPAAPSTTNQTAQTFDNILSSDAMGKLVPLAEAAANTAAEVAEPWLAAPVVKEVFEFLDDEAIEKLSGLLLQFAVQNGIKLIITVQTDVEKATYSAAEGDLKAALLTNDPAKIAAAKLEFNNAADGVIYSDGSVNTHPES